jgi:hypothetical protein
MLHACIFGACASFPGCLLALLYSMLHGIYCTLHVRRFVIDVISSFPYDEVLQGESAGQAKTSKATP